MHGTLKAKPVLLSRLIYIILYYLTGLYEGIPKQTTKQATDKPRPIPATHGPTTDKLTPKSPIIIAHTPQQHTSIADDDVALCLAHDTTQLAPKQSRSRRDPLPLAHHAKSQS